MDAVVFTKSRQEYGMLSGILADESPGMRVSQGSMDGHYHLEHKYDIVVVGVDGAQGMELVCAYRERFGDALVIWITDDPYFAGVAIRTHIFDFIVRPLAESRFRETVRKLMAGKTDSWQRIPTARGRRNIMRTPLPSGAAVKTAAIRKRMVRSQRRPTAKLCNMESRSR